MRNTKSDVRKNRECKSRSYEKHYKMYYACAGCIRANTCKREEEPERAGELSDHDANLTLDKGEGRIGRWECLRLLCNFRRVHKGFEEVLKPNWRSRFPAHHWLEAAYTKLSMNALMDLRGSSRGCGLSTLFAVRHPGVHDHGGHRCFLISKDSESLPPTNPVCSK